jgi:hypothetical protein
LVLTTNLKKLFPAAGSCQLDAALEANGGYQSEEVFIETTAPYINPLKGIYDRLDQLQIPISKAQEIMSQIQPKISQERIAEYGSRLT